MMEKSVEILSAEKLAEYRQQRESMNKLEEKS